MLLSKGGSTRTYIDQYFLSHKITFEPQIELSSLDLLIEFKKALISTLQNLIPQGAIIGSGDSVTLAQTGIFEFLRSNDYVVYKLDNI
ncbi:MAG: hypothetical protein FWE05_10620 [Defluviitaleaceae bacterium]|nr:hypothetical protein [Defluviitaleaceae bacterium]